MSIRLRTVLPLAALLGVTPTLAAQTGDQDGGGFEFAPPAPDDRGLGSTRGPRTREEDETLTSFTWRILWDVTEEHYLQRRAHVHGGVPDGGFFLGRGEKPQDPRPSLQVAPEDVEGRVLPLFVELLEEDGSPEVQAATLIAYARASRTQGPAGRSDVVARIRPFLADSSRDVSEAATIALGITGHFGAVATLGDVLTAEDAGREVTGGREVPYRQRAYAAYGIALAAADSDNEDVRLYAVQKLARAAADDEGRWGDLEVAALIGLGMVPLEDDGRTLESLDPEHVTIGGLAEQLGYLLRVVTDRDADRLARSHAASSIGRLVAPLPPPRREAYARELVPPIAELLKRGSRAPREVMQGAALALGNLIDDDDDQASDLGRNALRRVFDLHEDRLTQAFALLSLGRAAGRPGLGREAGIGAAEGRTLLLSTLLRGDTLQRTWSALSLGLHAYDLRVQGREVPSEVRAALREALKRTESPEELTANAIAVGLLRDVVAEPRIRKHAARSQNDLLRGLSSLAMGMLGAQESMPTARAAFFDLLDRPAALERAAYGRALLDDPDLVRDLERVLEDEGSLKGRMAMLLALGRFGDIRALDTILAWARPRAGTSELRAVAVAALGQLCEPDPIPWPARIGWQVNAYARTETLRGSGRGVLDAR